MKRILKATAVSILGLGLTAGILPAQTFYNDGGRGRETQRVYDHRDDRDRHDRNRHERDRRREERGRRYDRDRDYRR